MFSSFGQTLKGMIYEDDASTKPASAPAAPPAGPTAGLGTVAQHVSAAVPASYGVNQEMVAVIRKATLSRNSAFTQLLHASEALADVIPDDVMRLKAAHKTSGAGRTGKQIADAVDVHLQDVEGEVMRFGATLNKQIEADVGGLKRQAATAEIAATTANDEIKRLTERITQLQTQVAEETAKSREFNAQAQARENELRQAETDFKGAAQAVRDELNMKKSAILSTLV